MADLYLTRFAKAELNEIYDYSMQQWGEKRADQYLDSLMEQLVKISEKPQLGYLRKSRSHPFLMAPIEQHFAIFKEIGSGIIVATVLHSKRDIEAVVLRYLDYLTQAIEEIEGSLAEDM